MIDVPSQVPVVVVSVDPSTAEPEMNGSAVFTGVVWAVTRAVGADCAFAEPSPLVAVTSTRSVEPTSPALTTWVWDVSPIGAQEPPPASHRCHANAYEMVGVPVHEPVVAVSVSPETAVPVIVGGSELDGTAAELASAPVDNSAADAASATMSSASTVKARRFLARAARRRMASDMVDSLPRFGHGS